MNPFTLSGMSRAEIDALFDVAHDEYKTVCAQNETLKKEVAWLRAELKEYNELSPIVQKLAKARAALKHFRQRIVKRHEESFRPTKAPLSAWLLMSTDEIDQTLKEIDE